MAVVPEYHRGATEGEVRRRTGRWVLAMGLVAAILQVLGAALLEGILNGFMTLPQAVWVWLLGLALVFGGWMVGLVLVVLGLVSVRQLRHNGLAMMGYGLGLAAVVVPVVWVVRMGNSRIEMARRNSTISMISQFGTELDSFEKDTGRYPTTAEGLDALFHVPAGLEAAWKGPYHGGGRLPLDGWGHAYIYRMPGKKDSKEYDLISAGSDGKEGTADDLDRGSL